MSIWFWCAGVEEGAACDTGIWSISRCETSTSSSEQASEPETLSVGSEEQSMQMPDWADTCALVDQARPSLPFIPNDSGNNQRHSVPRPASCPYHAPGFPPGTWWCLLLLSNEHVSVISNCLFAVGVRRQSSTSSYLLHAYAGSGDVPGVQHCKE